MSSPTYLLACFPRALPPFLQHLSAEKGWLVSGHPALSPVAMETLNFSLARKDSSSRDQLESAPLSWDLAFLCSSSPLHRLFPPPGTFLPIFLQLANSYSSIKAHISSKKLPDPLRQRQPSMFIQ